MLGVTVLIVGFASLILIIAFELFREIVAKSAGIRGTTFRDLILLVFRILFCSAAELLSYCINKPRGPVCASSSTLNDMEIWFELINLAEFLVILTPPKDEVTDVI
jgi:hypothetical protein